MDEVSLLPYIQYINNIYKVERAYLSFKFYLKMSVRSSIEVPYLLQSVYRGIEYYIYTDDTANEVSTNFNYFSLFILRTT